MCCPTTTTLGDIEVYPPHSIKGDTVKITEVALHKYFKELLQCPRIKDFIVEYAVDQHGVFILKSNTGDILLPSLRIIDTAGVKYAGVAHTDMAIDISRWILVDKAEAKATVRHELAHLLHSYSKVKGRSHGKEFHKILKVVSPMMWRRDRHWCPNPVIEKARIKVHPASSPMQTIKVGKRTYAKRV